MSIATCWMALGWTLCRSNSAANASQTEASFPGVAKATSCQSGWRTLSGSCALCSGSSRRLPPQLGVKAQPCMRRFHVGEDHPPHPRVAHAEDLAGTLHQHLVHQGHCEGLELLGEVLATPLPGRGHTVHLAVIAMASLRQGTHHDTLLVKDVQMPPLHLLDMVLAGHRGPGSITLLGSQRGSFLDLHHKSLGE